MVLQSGHQTISLDVFGEVSSTTPKCAKTILVKEIGRYVSGSGAHVREADSISLVTCALQNIKIDEVWPPQLLELRGCIGANLAAGYEKYEPPSPEEVYLVEETLRRIRPTKARRVVSLRRILCKLMLIPLRPAEPLKFTISTEQNTSVLRFEGRPSSRTLVGYTGFGFERCVTSSNHTFHSVVRQRLSSTIVEFSAEIDAHHNHEYIELKTHPHKLRGPDLDRKLMAAWAQTTLVDTKQIIVGFRSKTKRGYKLAAYQRYRVDDIPHMIRTKHSVHNDFGLHISCEYLLRWYTSVMDWLVKHTDVEGKYELEYTGGSALGECKLQLKRAH